MPWQTIKTTFGSHHGLLSGKIAVGKADWNHTRSKGDGPENAYRWSLLLPGNKRDGVTSSLEDAKAACEVAFEDWLVSAGLSRKEGMI